MTGRLASRSAEAEALLLRFIQASNEALEALDRRDSDAVTRALEVRDELQHKIDRMSREIAITRSRFATTGRTPRLDVVDRALEQYCAPLEELARTAQALQKRLELSAGRWRDGLERELASLDTAAGVATRYATIANSDSHRFDVIL
jgi:hypothetical protein